MARLKSLRARVSLTTQRQFFHRWSQSVSAISRCKSIRLEALRSIVLGLQKGRAMYSAKLFFYQWRNRARFSQYQAQSREQVSY